MPIHCIRYIYWTYRSGAANLTEVRDLAPQNNAAKGIPRRKAGATQLGITSKLACLFGRVDRTGEEGMAEEKKNVMTTDAGRPVGDNQNSLTVGPRGPVVFEDFLLFEKMAHFNRERIPERVV